MADDPYAEARDRIIACLVSDENIGTNPHLFDLADHIADTILEEVFPVAFWLPVWHGETREPRRYLALYSPSEPCP